MYFGTRAARTCITHFPKVIVLVSVYYMALWQMPFPNRRSLIITAKAFSLRPLEHRSIQIGRIKFQNIHQIFPRPVYCLFLEIIAKRPVSKHFKHGVVVCVHANFFQIVMFATYAQTFLRICNTAIFGRDIAQYNIFELIHSGIGKHQCRIVFNNHRCRRDYLMSLTSEKLFIRFTYLLCCKHNVYLIQQLVSLFFLVDKVNKIYRHISR